MTGLVSAADLIAALSKVPADTPVLISWPDEGQGAPLGLVYVDEIDAHGEGYYRREGLEVGTVVVELAPYDIADHPNLLEQP